MKEEVEFLATEALVAGGVLQTFHSSAIFRCDRRCGVRREGDLFQRRDDPDLLREERAGVPELVARPQRTFFRDRRKRERDSYGHTVRGSIRINPQTQ